MFYMIPLNFNFCGCFYLLIHVGTCCFCFSFRINISVLLRLSRRFIHSTLAAADCSTLAVCVSLLLLLPLLAPHFLAFVIAVIIAIVIMAMDLVKSAAHYMARVVSANIMKSNTTTASVFWFLSMLLCEMNLVYLFTLNT